MLPERLNFLKRFDNFYQVMTNEVKENKVNEKDFYMIMGAKIKQLDQDRREKQGKRKRKIKADLKY